MLFAQDTKFLKDQKQNTLNLCFNQINFLIDTTFNKM